MSLKEIKSATLHTFNSEEKWLQARQRGIGASDIASICNLSPWSSEFKIWAEKTGSVGLKRSSEAMRWGLKIEPLLRENYIEDLKLDKKRLWHKENSLFRNKKNPLYQASLDGYIKGKKIIFEGKTTSHFNSKDWGNPYTDEIPEYYLSQCMWQMGVIKEAKHVDLAVLISGSKFRIYRIYRNDKVIKGLQDKADKFWENVKSKNPPSAEDPSEATKRALEEVFGASGEEIIQGNRSSEKVMKELNNLAEEIKIKSTKKEELSNKLRRIIGDNAGVMAGSYCYTWKTRKTKRLDQSSLKEGDLKIYMKHLRESTTRVLLPKKTKKGFNVK